MIYSSARETESIYYPTFLPPSKMSRKTTRQNKLPISQSTPGITSTPRTHTYHYIPTKTYTTQTKSKNKNNKNIPQIPKCCAKFVTPEPNKPLSGSTLSPDELFPVPLKARQPGHPEPNRENPFRQGHVGSGARCRDVEGERLYRIQDILWLSLSTCVIFTEHWLFESVVRRFFIIIFKLFYLPFGEWVLGSFFSFFFFDWGFGLNDVKQAPSTRWRNIVQGVTCIFFVVTILFMCIC